MRVEFDGSALVGTECAPEIVAIAALCALKGSPHRLVTDEVALRNWAMSQVPTLAEWIGLIAEMGREAEEGAGRPIRGTLTVLPTNADSSRWRRPARAALALLRRPFRVVLENSRADRAFLLAFAPLDVRNEMLSWERDGWLELHGVGGDDQVVQVAESILKGADCALRHAFLMDSDRRFAGALPERAQKMQAVINEAAGRLEIAPAVVGHVLEARAIENYAPPREMLTHLTQKHPNPKNAAGLVDSVKHGRSHAFHGQGDEPLAFGAAWSMLNWDQRSYLDVKNGLGDVQGGQGNARNASDVVETVPKALLPFLSKGLGRDFAGTFYEEHQGLRHANNEITDMLQAFLERV